MSYWLLKTEPTEYSFDQLVEDQRTVWDGIANPLALKYLREAQKGDHLVIYHTGSERRAVGTAVIVRAAYDDPKTGGHHPVIDVAAKERLPQPVDFAAMKADPAFEESALTRQARLSFVPLTDGQWARLMVLGKKKSRR